MPFIDNDLLWCPDSDGKMVDLSCLDNGPNVVVEQQPQELAELSHSDLHGLVPELEEEEILRQLGDPSLELDNIFAEFDAKVEESTFLSHNIHAVLQVNCDGQESNSPIHSPNDVYMTTVIKKELPVGCYVNSNLTPTSVPTNGGSSVANDNDIFTRPSCERNKTVNSRFSSSVPSSECSTNYMSCASFVFSDSQSGVRKVDSDLFYERKKQINNLLRTRSDQNNNHFFNKVQKSISNPMLRRALSSPQSDVFSTDSSNQTKFFTNDEKLTKILSRSLSVQNNMKNSTNVKIEPVTESLPELSPSTIESTGKF
ncbi:Uncharacterised protein g10021 [Pycnogonum litorale]